MNEDREPQPTDGPEYHADHAAWERRQRTQVVISDPPTEDTSVPLDMRIEMFKIVIQSGLQPRGETFTERVKERTEATDFIIEAFLKLREKETREARLFDAMAQMVMDTWPQDIIEGGLPDVVQRVFEHRDMLRSALYSVLIHMEACGYRGKLSGQRDENHRKTCDFCTVMDALEPYGVPG